VTLGYLERRFAYDPPWWDVFVQTPSGAGAVHRLIASGEIPWWTAPDIKMHFHRILPSVMLAFERVLFGHAPLGWHVGSLLWYLALLVAAAAFFRSVLPPATAHLSLLVFALADANVFPFAWPAALYAPMGATFAALGAVAHVRYRREGWGPGRWLAPAALLAGLLSGEAALGGFAFVAAYDLVGPVQGTARDRFARAAPLATLGLGYLVVYAAVGGGVSGSAGYISPLSEPAAFLAAAATRIPVFLCDVVLGVPADLAFLGFTPVLAVGGVVASLLFVLFGRASAPFVPDEERAALRWLGLGAFGAMAVGLGGLIGSRDLLLANFGFAPIIAVAIRAGFAPGRLAPLRRAGAWLLVAAHVALAPIGQVANEVTMIVTARATEATAHAIEKEASGARRVMIVAASDPMASWYPLAVMATESPAPLPCWSWLSGVPADVTVTRSGPASFFLEPHGTTFLRAPFETLDRDPRIAFHVGDEVTTCGVRVRVATVEGGRPARIEVSSDADLDSPETAWLAWQSGAMKRVGFPRAGESVTIPWSIGPSGMF
jgi:hypothetical protein